jgi:TyrR family helix-turn-helix protein
MTKEELVRLLNTHGKVKDISINTGLSLTQIYKYIKQYGIELPSKKISKEKLSEMYQYLSSRQIAKELDCSHQTIVNWLDKYQIQKKDRGQPPLKNKYRINKDLLNTYVKQFRSINKISKHTNIPVKVLKDLMQDYGLSKIKIDKEYLEKEFIYNQKSVKQIALECSVCDKTIYFYLKKFKIKQ